MRPLPEAVPPLAPAGAWLVVPAAAARTTAALDRLLEGAARACGAAELRIRDAAGDTGVHLVAVHGADVAALANVMSLVEPRVAALHLAGDRGATVRFHGGARTDTVRGSARRAAAAAAEHVGVAAEEVLAVAAAHAVTSQPRIVRRDRTSPASCDPADLVWNTAVDEEFHAELAALRLAHADAALADRFDAGAYELVVSAVRTLLPDVPLRIAVRALELRGLASHHVAALRARPA